MRPDDPRPHHLSIGEAEARRLLVVHALDGVDAQGHLIGREERQRIDQEALARTGDPARGQPVDSRAWLLARADAMLGVLRHRQPRLASLADRPAWHAWMAWGLPVAALLAGGVIDRIDNPKQVNLLSPPLLAFLLWNVAVYVLVLVLAWPRTQRPGAGGQPWWALLESRWGGTQADVAKAFAMAWWRSAGALEGQRWRRILHTCAAAWACGVAVSIVLGGLVREYRVGWESTLLDLPQVHALLSVLFAPVVALLPIEPFSQAELARLHFGSGADVGRLEARRWVGLYLALLVVVVVIPRTLLAGWAAWRQHRLAQRVRIDLREPGFAALLAAVLPVQLQVLLTVGPGAAGTALSTVLRQATDVPMPTQPEVPWTVLSTPRGDALTVVRAPPLQGPAAVRPRFAWMRTEDDGVAHADLPDLVLCVSASGAVEPSFPVPTLVLTPQAPAQGGHAAGGSVLGLDQLPHWRCDERLRAAVQRLLPAHQAGGLERLWTAWREQAQRRFTRSCEVLADELLAHARDAQPVGMQPLGMRQLVVRSEREAAQDARESAMRELAGRVRDRLSAADARIAGLHGVSGLEQGSGWGLDDAQGDGFHIHQPVHASQAGLAGAASGAAMGATVDLLTGGLTLGAASALGALVGGGAALAAAAWKNRSGEVASVVLLDDTQLHALAVRSLAHYLAVAHSGRAPVPQSEQLLAASREALLPRDQELRDAWATARKSPAEAQQAALRLGNELQAAAAQALDRLQS